MLWYVLLGTSTGMRTMTAIAVVCWFSWLGLLPQTGWSHWSAMLVSSLVFTLCAVGEYFGDTRPAAPDRTSAMPLLARFAFGGLVGSLAAHAIGEPVAGGILFAFVGVLIGAFGGMRLRLWVAGRVRRDLPVALSESVLALLFAALGAWMLHYEDLVNNALMILPRLRSL